MTLNEKPRLLTWRRKTLPDLERIRLVCKHAETKENRRGWIWAGRRAYFPKRRLKLRT